MITQTIKQRPSIDKVLADATHTSDLILKDVKTSPFPKELNKTLPLDVALEIHFFISTLNTKQ